MPSIAPCSIEPALKADAERVNAPRRASAKQAGKYANPDLIYQNENLMPGQTYARDVDTLAYISQPLDLFGPAAPRVSPPPTQSVARAEAGLCPRADRHGTSRQHRCTGRHAGRRTRATS